METKKKHRAKAQEQVLSLVLISVHCDLIRARRQSRATTRSVSFLFYFCLFFIPLPRPVIRLPPLLFLFIGCKKKNREGKKKTNKKRIQQTNRQSNKTHTNKKRDEQRLRDLSALLLLLLLSLLLLFGCCCCCCPPVRYRVPDQVGVVLRSQNRFDQSESRSEDAFYWWPMAALLVTKKKTPFKSKRIASAFQNGGRYDHFFSLFFLFPKDVFLAQL